MVCNRCKTAVKTIIESHNFQVKTIELGEIEIAEEISATQLETMNAELKQLGFEIIDNRKGRTIEKIKNLIIKMVHYPEDTINTNLSSYITSEIPNDYKYLSNLFSEVEGTTIEKYFITQKIERVKELLVYDELSLSEISYRMGYSSSAYLSSQFKKVTGLTPTFYKLLKEHKRINIDNL